jgi:hypothetical protein
VAAAIALWLQYHRHALESYERWERVAAARLALFRSSDLSGGKPLLFGNGALKVNSMLNVDPVRRSSPEPKAVSPLGAIGATIVRDCAKARRIEMIRLEIMQLFASNPALADLFDSVDGSTELDEVKAAVLNALSESDELSSTARKMLSIDRSS